MSFAYFLFKTVTKCRILFKIYHQGFINYETAPALNLG